MWRNETTLEQGDGIVTSKVTALLIILAVSIIGNGLVIVIVQRSRRNQWTTNHFVLNLATINLVAPTLYLSLALGRVHGDEWLYGNVGCKTWAFLEHFNRWVSVGILCCMSVDRFYLTAFPLTFKLSKWQTKNIIIIIWLLAAILCSPLFYFYQVDSVSSPKDCSILPTSRNWTAYMYTAAIVFLLSLLATYVMYVKVCLCILARNNETAGLNRHRRFTRKVPRTKIKVTKLLIVQLVCHSLLWLPLILYELASSTTAVAVTDATANTVTRYLAYVSSAASPLVYTAFSGDFRRGFKQILVKYDPSKAYRLPPSWERKNRVDVMPDFMSDSGVRRISTKAESREHAHGITFEMAKKTKLAWTKDSVSTR